MKKILCLLLGLLLLTGCSARMTGQYTVINETGEKLTELYLYETGSAKKGINLANDQDEIQLAMSGNEKTQLTLEFTTESGYNAAFTTLAIEEATIRLLAVDAVSGATPISFDVPH